MAKLGLKQCIGAMVALTAAIACGPHVLVADTETTSGGASTSSAGASATTATGTTAGATSLPVTTGVGVTTSPQPPEATSETAGDESSEGESSTGGDCRCESVEIPFDAMTDDGFSAAEMLAATAGLEVPLLWYAIADNPTTSASITLSLADGPILDEPGGFCRLFLRMACNDGITIPVNITIATDDGILAEDVPGRIQGNLDFIRIESDVLSTREGGGEWTTQPFSIKGTPIDVASLRFSAERSPALSREWLLVWGLGDWGTEQLAATQL